ncbi:MAG: hypothetical protein WBW33_06395 [Bryobacteraceae bacterium]
MKFIEDKLNSIGKLNFIVFIHDNEAGKDWTNSWTIDLESVRASPETARVIPANCRLDYHLSKVLDGKSVVDADRWLHLKTIQEIDVITFERSLKETIAKAGQLGLSVRADPPIFQVELQNKNGDEVGEFYILKEALANRVAAALNHAVELCGGGSKEPF